MTTTPSSDDDTDAAEAQAMRDGSSLFEAVALVAMLRDKRLQGKSPRGVMNTLTLALVHVAKQDGEALFGEALSDDDARHGVISAMLAIWQGYDILIGLDQQAKETQH